MKMKKNKIFIFSLLIAISFAFLSSCMKEEWEYPEPMEYPNFNDSSNYKVLSIKELKSLYSGATLALNDSIVIEGTVISSDEFGNIYKEMYIQDTSGGLLIQIDRKEIYKTYPIGKKLSIKCGGLYLGASNDVIKLGALYWNDDVWAFGRIQGDKVINEHFFKTEGINPIEPKVVKINELTEDDKQTLIKFENVQFQEINQTYASPNASVNRTIIDIDNHTIICRNSSFATFALDTMPTGSGSIICIYSNFFTDKQVYINSTEDVNLTQPRF